MSFEEANSGNVNPNFNNIEKGYYTNCQSCVVCFELRRRGYNVQTLPNIDGSMLDKLAKRPNYAWINIETGLPPKLFGIIVDNKDPNETYKDIENNIKDGERYTLFYKKEGYKTGHIVNIEKNNNEIIVYDGQDGTITKGKENIIEEYCEEIIEMGIFRIDDCAFNMDIVNNIVKGY